MVYLDGLDIGECQNKIRITSTHDGPDIRTIAIAARPEAVDRAKMVSSWKSDNCNF
jgi:hypothetical protein